MGVELKATAFKPEYLGQINLYMSAVDDLLGHPDDQPTIGLLLCRTKNNVVAEYALRGFRQTDRCRRMGSRNRGLAS
ncbi:PDDEXK nuclease domain-containing protein [Arthrobacter silvisoli]|uniref:PDDEXK nuclease domain-containing protein n=1 Tax=Arthrobacter silvisoli TaxID=2291022 RepID=UPI0024823421|nr:PDDEXK nuclease domain-containing protein [Arthrobacter silvisoli]